MRIGCKPPTDNPSAELELYRGSALQDRRRPAPDDWELELEPERYKALAKIGGGTRATDLIVRPPFTRAEL